MVIRIVKYIMIALVYLGFFTVQLGSSFIIQENIQLNNSKTAIIQAALNDYNKQHIASCKVLAKIKKRSHKKKPYLNRRFYPSSTNEVSAKLPKVPIHYTDKAANALFIASSIEKSKFLLLEDRGPPAII